LISVSVFNITTHGGEKIDESFRVSGVVF